MSTATLRASARVDRVNNIIYGAALLKIGKVRDARGWTISSRTLNQVFNYSSQSVDGVKARFDHPEAGKSSLGSYLGQWRNFRIDGIVLRADLHFAQAAFKSPHGDLATYLMDRAEDAPDSFGVSIHAPFAADFDGNELSFSGVRAFDIVEDPAGTDGGMFSVVEATVKLSYEQRQQYIARERAKHNRFLGVEEPMNQDQKYEQIYQADLKAMGGKLSVSKEAYIASLKASDNGGEVNLSDSGSQPAATNTAPLSSTGNHYDDSKYRAQYQADKAVLGDLMISTEAEYIASLKTTDAGGVLHLH